MGWGSKLFLWEDIPANILSVAVEPLEDILTAKFFWNKNSYSFAVIILIEIAYNNFWEYQREA